MFYEEHRIALDQAAAWLAGNEWAGFDSNFANTTADKLNVVPDMIVRAVVTTQCPAAIKSNGPPVEWEAGLGGIATVYSMVGRGTATAGDDIYIDGSNGQTLHFAESDDITGTGTLSVDIVNLREETIAVDEVVDLFIVNDRYCAFPTSESGAAAPKRVKFKLTAPLYNPSPGFDGSATATVIDPMNSGLSMGASIQVYDFQKQFEFTQTDSIGIAVQSVFNGTSSGLWHIESCTQLVKRALINLTDDLAPFLVTSIPPSTFTKSMSDWPHVLWATFRDYDNEGIATRETVSEGIGASVPNIKNPHGFVAASGWAIVERRPTQAQIQAPDNQAVPYSVDIQDWEWHIVDVENEVAEYVKTRFDGTNFIMELAGTNYFANGVSPDTMTHFTGVDTCNPPDELWTDFNDRVCHIPNSTLGWAYLNKNVGKYQTIMTNSALFGNGEVVKAVANYKSETGNLIYDHEADCGKFRYNTLTNMIVFGNNDSGDSCQMKLDPVPDNEVDVFAQASDVEVVTSVAINVSGELEMTRSTIKACDTAGTDQTIPLQSMDVVNDVYCSGDSLTKDYKTIKFLGSVDSSVSGVAIDTSCIDIDYYQITHPTYPYIDYYDILWPVGCDPCPSEPEGCCTITYSDTSTEDVGSVTEDWCTAQATDRPDVTSSVWASGACSGGSGCDGNKVSGFSIGGFASTGCSATFTQTGTATITGGTATITGDWSGLANGFPVGSVSGTFTFTTDGTNHSATGVLPSDWGSNTVDVSDSGSCTGTFSGTATLTGSGTPCDDMINGTYDFDLIT